MADEEKDERDEEKAVSTEKEAEESAVEISTDPVGEELAEAEEVSQCGDRMHTHNTHRMCQHSAVSYPQFISIHTLQ